MCVIHLRHQKWNTHKCGRDKHRRARCIGRARLGFSAGLSQLLYCQEVCVITSVQLITVSFHAGFELTVSLLHAVNFFFKKPK